MPRHCARPPFAILNAVSAVAEALGAYYGQGIFGSSRRDTLPSPFDGTKALKKLSNQALGFVLLAIFERDGQRSNRASNY
jgi:hypothetical protein